MRLPRRRLHPDDRAAIVRAVSEAVKEHLAAELAKARGEMSKHASRLHDRLGDTSEQMAKVRGDVSGLGDEITALGARVGELAAADAEIARLRGANKVLTAELAKLRATVPSPPVAAAGGVPAADGNPGTPAAATVPVVAKAARTRKTAAAKNGGMT